MERREKAGYILTDIYAGGLSKLEDKLVCHFKLVVDMVEVMSEILYITWTRIHFSLLRLG